MLSVDLLDCNSALYYVDWRKICVAPIVCPLWFIFHKFYYILFSNKNYNYVNIM